MQLLCKSECLTHWFSQGCCSQEKKVRPESSCTPVMEEELDLMRTADWMREEPGVKARDEWAEGEIMTSLSVTTERERQQDNGGVESERWRVEGEREKPSVLPWSFVDTAVVWGHIWGQLIPLINASGFTNRHSERCTRCFVLLSLWENSFFNTSVLDNLYLSYRYKFPGERGPLLADLQHNSCSSCVRTQPLSLWH